MELVVYNEAKVESSLELPFRLFSFFDKDIKIIQKWLPDGHGGTKIGFGASVYDCSYVLSSYIENKSNIVFNKSVIEIGCGPGLTSIVTALAGARIVVCTDGDDQSIRLAKENVLLSGVNNNNNQQYSTMVQLLLWGNENHLTEAINNNSNKQFDVIIASDVAALPYAEHFDLLLETFIKLLSPSGFVYLSYQRRHSEEDLFFQKVNKYFNVIQCSKDNIHKDFRDRKDIFIFQLDKIDKS